jgi:flagellar hook-associated protein 1
MSGLTLALEIAKNTLLNTQVQMGTASHNIANADNKAYARQKALLVTNLPYETQAGFLGMGARVDQVVQQRDQFIERSLVGSISKESDYKARSSLLATAVAQLLDNGGQGISGALGAFWDSWEALSQNPSGASEKTLVSQATKNLALAIRDAVGSIADTADNVEAEAKSEVSTVNSLLSDIASYNKEIMGSELGGESANDLRDLRYQTLTKLAESLPISYKEETNGSLTITVKDYSGDITLVSASQPGKLTYDSTNHRVTYSDYQDTTYPTPPDSDPPAENQLSAGRLNGVMTVYKAIGTSHDLADVLADPNAANLTYVDRLNALASTLITEVNAAYGSDVFSGTDASDINIDSSFSLGASLDPNVALSVSTLQETKLSPLGDSQFSGYLSDIQQRLGLDQQHALALGSFQEALRQQLEGQQQSASGVSIDEEMVDLLKFQQVYQAAAKVIQHTSEMLDVIMKMI